MYGPAVRCKRFFVDLVGAGLASMYPASRWSIAPGHHGYQRACDDLVLGIKGQFAQAELHIIRARLHGAKLNKAQKGELRFPVPVGFVYDADKIVLDPDQEVQGAVRAVFELFEQENS